MTTFVFIQIFFLLCTLGTTINKIVFVCFTYVHVRTLYIHLHEHTHTPLTHAHTYTPLTRTHTHTHTHTHTISKHSENREEEVFRVQRLHGNSYLHKNHSSMILAASQAPDFALASVWLYSAHKLSSHSRHQQHTHNCHLSYSTCHICPV